MAISVVAATSARGSYFDVIGVTALRATTNLDGSGISVGQAEASDSTTTNNVFEVNPAAVSQPTNLFTYFISNPPYLTFSSSTNYTNPLGVESGHADDVGLDFYGPSGGVATNVEHVDNYQADGFYGYNIAGGHAIGERIVNQSFTFGTNDPTLDQNYDNYAAQHGVLFITGAGFPGGPIYSPATCYNGIGVSVTGVSNPLYGPTPDGRSKPDICAPGPQGAETS
ncbi:MAG: hypothetical protein KGR98_08820, partial [Verrucomicrobia bacterium]|nr:hypothetical protein [Verrucomicrobiota bacterium]